MMSRWNSLNRKTFVTALGTAGLGMGLIVATAGGVPGALAQESATPAQAQDEAETGEGEVRERLRSGEMREELYAEFTAALADELGIGNSDEVDAAIRVAMMTVVDARVDDGLLTAGQAEALKTLIATSDVPLGPGPMFGPPPGVFMRGGHGPGEEGRFFPIRGGDEDWIINADDDSRGDVGEVQNADSDENANDDTDSNQDDADDESS
jgi:hypothetical protein